MVFQINALGIFQALEGSKSYNFTETRYGPKIP
jgi:hypothetical protein